MPSYMMNYYRFIIVLNFDFNFIFHIIHIPYSVGIFRIPYHALYARCKLCTTINDWIWWLPNCQYTGVIQYEFIQLRIMKCAWWHLGPFIMNFVDFLPHFLGSGWRCINKIIMFEFGFRWGNFRAKMLSKVKTKRNEMKEFLIACQLIADAVHYLGIINCTSW